MIYSTECQRYIYEANKSLRQPSLRWVTYLYYEFCMQNNPRLAKRGSFDKAQEPSLCFLSIAACFPNYSVLVTFTQFQFLKGGSIKPPNLQRACDKQSW